MGIVRSLQHWLGGHGPHLQPAAFVPETHPIRLWADTFPWDAMVQAVAQSFAQRFPKKRPTGGRPSVSLRVLLALELLNHELNASDEDICQRLRTDVAVMYACGLPEVPAEQGSQRVTDATTLYKAQKNSSTSWNASASSVRFQARA